MEEARASLPIAKLKDQFLELLRENDVIVVCGETGCGKTTQVIPLSLSQVSIRCFFVPFAVF
jgi:HrpA-like RNA helicase